MCLAPFGLLRYKWHNIAHARIITTTIITKVALKTAVAVIVAKTITKKKPITKINFKCSSHDVVRERVVLWFG